MNPAEKGWLKDYLKFRKKQGQVSGCKQMQKEMLALPTEDEFLYCLLQPTGLMYGHPAQFPNISHPEAKGWKYRDRMKVIMAESFISSSMYFLADDLVSKKDREEAYQELIRNVAAFYTEIFPQLAHKAGKGLFGRKRKEIEQTESILSSRIDLKQKWDKNFWTSFFQNSLLFLDVFYFTKWIKPGHLTTIEEIHELHDNIRLSVLQVIASAANANHIIEIEERNLYEYFLHSADLPVEKEREAAKYIDQGFSLEDINFNNLDSWILKKYFLELAILTIWSDQEVHDEEKEFIEKLAVKLDFDEQELESSMLAIESFVLQNYEQVHYLQERQNYKIVTERFIKNMSNVLGFYKKGIVQEVRESRELIFLLNKSVKEELSDEEREKVRQQLLDILKAVPLFALIALPGRTLTLPIIFKVLPKNVLPSSFQKK